MTGSESLTLTNNGLYNEQMNEKKEGGVREKALLIILWFTLI